MLKIEWHEMNSEGIAVTQVSDTGVFIEHWSNI